MLPLLLLLLDQVLLVVSVRTQHTCHLFVAIPNGEAQRCAAALLETTVKAVCKVHLWAGRAERPL